MRPVTVQLSAQGLSAPVVLDYHLTPFQAMLSYEPSGAVAQATVQWSPDDPFGVYAVDYNTNANWFDIPAMTAMAASTNYTLGGTGSDNNFPARAVRLKNNTYTSGTNQLVVTQAGGIA